MMRRAFALVVVFGLAGCGVEMQTGDVESAQKAKPDAGSTTGKGGKNGGGGGGVADLSVMKDGSVIRYDLSPGKDGSGSGSSDGSAPKDGGVRFDLTSNHVDLSPGKDGSVIHSDLGAGTDGAIRVDLSTTGRVDLSTTSSPADLSVSHD
jgi:hypothetical protein